jgi:hypothetical protein
VGLGPSAAVKRWHRWRSSAGRGVEGAAEGQVEHDEGVAATHVIEGDGQAGPGGALGAGCLVEVDPGATGGRGLEPMLLLLLLLP